MISCGTGSSWWDQSSAECTPVADHHIMEWMGTIIQDDMYLWQHPPFWHHCQKVQLHSHNATGLVDQSVQSFVVRYPQPAVDVEEPLPSQKIEMTLSLPVEDDSVLYPVQIIISVDLQIRIILQNVHTDPLDGDSGLRSTTSSFVFVDGSAHTMWQSCPFAPSLIHPTIAESPENFWRWQVSVQLMKSLVSRVKRKGESTVYSISIADLSDTQWFKRTCCGLPVRSRSQGKNLPASLSASHPVEPGGCVECSGESQKTWLSQCSLVCPGGDSIINSKFGLMDKL